ncbi:hypothetical protein DID75_01670 [Candidatus Marinamargulisbacteria bacterium SCGC AG-410-N11]|nr:hypothetical protein DID75_01670 [Candidatus Marinamargulisbacteria bacterium SCGC AG-410-N11]
MKQYKIIATSSLLSFYPIRSSHPINQIKISTNSKGVNPKLFKEYDRYTFYQGDVSVGWSTYGINKERGLFAKNLIKTGDIIGVYGGVITNPIEEDINNDKYFQIGKSRRSINGNCPQMDKSLDQYSSNIELNNKYSSQNFMRGFYCQTINDFSFPGIGSFINTDLANEKNNATAVNIELSQCVTQSIKNTTRKSKKWIIFQAIKNINPGEEILYNYGKDYTKRLSNKILNSNGLIIYKVNKKTTKIPIIKIKQEPLSDTEINEKNKTPVTKKRRITLSSTPKAQNHRQNDILEVVSEESTNNAITSSPQLNTFLKTYKRNFLYKKRTLIIKKYCHNLKDLIIFLNHIKLKIIEDNIIFEKFCTSLDSTLDLIKKINTLNSNTQQKHPPISKYILEKIRNKYCQSGPEITQFLNHTKSYKINFHCDDYITLLNYKVNSFKKAKDFLKHLENNQLAFSIQLYNGILKSNDFSLSESLSLLREPINKNSFNSDSITLLLKSCVTLTQALSIAIESVKRNIYLSEESLLMMFKKCNTHNDYILCLNIQKNRTKFSSKTNKAIKLLNTHKTTELCINNKNLSNFKFILLCKEYLTENTSHIKKIHLPNNHLSSIGIKQLSFFKNLEDLDLSNNNINSVENLAPLTKLHTLNLSNNQCTNKFDTFNQLTNLSTLNLSNNNLSIHHLSHLSNLINLKNLDISSNNILNEATQKLTPLHKLEFLNINKTAITIQGIETLKKLSHLKILILDKNYFPKITRKSINIILNKAANLEISYE